MKEKKLRALLAAASAGRKMTGCPKGHLFGKGYDRCTDCDDCPDHLYQKCGAQYSAQIAMLVPKIAK